MLEVPKCYKALLLLLSPQLPVAFPFRRKHKQVWTQQWTPARFPCSADSSHHRLVPSNWVRVPRGCNQLRGKVVWCTTPGVGAVQRALVSTANRKGHGPRHPAPVVRSQIAQIRGVGLSNHHFGQAHISQLHQSVLVPGYGGNVESCLCTMMGPLHTLPISNTCQQAYK